MEALVRQVMTEQTEHLHLGPDAATVALHAAMTRRRGRRRLALAAGSGAVVAVAATGIAAATGAVPWWTSHQLDSTPFLSSPDPAAVPGSHTRFTLPGPESTTFAIVTNTVTVGTTQVVCTALQVSDGRGRSQHLTSSCGTPDMAVARAGSIDWQAPSGTTYVIATGPTPTPGTEKVVLEDGNGKVIASQPVGGGYYLIYAPAAQLPPTGTLTFNDAAGHVIDQFTIDLAPLAQPATSAATP